MYLLLFKNAAFLTKIMNNVPILQSVYLANRHIRILAHY